MRVEYEWDYDTEPCSYYGKGKKTKTESEDRENVREHICENREV